MYMIPKSDFENTVIIFFEPQELSTKVCNKDHEQPL
jgi:hypothetical protein